MQCLRPQKEHPGQEELVSKLRLEDQLTHAASVAPCNGHGKSDGEEVLHIQPEVPPTEIVSKAAALKSRTETVTDLSEAAAAAAQGTAVEKPAQEEASQPFTGCEKAVGVSAQLADDPADPRSAPMSAAAPGLEDAVPTELLQAASSSGAPHCPSLTDADTEKPGETGGGSAEDEADDNASVSSDGTLDCTSTPVAIGQDPFAGFRQRSAKHVEGPSFQYGSFAKSLLNEDSRAFTPEEEPRQGVLIIEDAVSLISSPSLPRTHSRPYTPLKYSPREQTPADSQPSVHARRSQHSVTTNALWQSSAQAHDREKERPNRLTISSDSSNDELKQPRPLKESSRGDQHKSHEPIRGSKGRRSKQHRRKQRSAELAPPSVEHDALKPQSPDGRKVQVPPGPASGILHPPLLLTQHAGIPGSAHSIDWVREHSSAMHGGDHSQHSVHSMAQLQSDLQHAQAAELHYLGTVARLSARLESSIAQEGILKQRLQQLEASSSSQRAGAHPAQEQSRQPWAGQLLLAQQGMQHESRMQPQLSRQASRASQQPSEQGCPSETLDDAAPPRAGALDAQQEVIEKLEGKLQAVMASLAKDHAELEELRRSSAAAAPDRASLGSRAVTDRDAELLSGAQDDAKELRSELAKARQRTEQFAAEARSADQSVRKLKQEAGELKAALSSSQAECNHLRQQMREVNLEVKAAAAGEQELKGECNSLRLAVDAARQAVAAKDAECMRLQQSLHSSRCELVELAAKHRQLERSVLVGQLQLDTAGRRSSLISGPEAQRGAQPAGQPDFSPQTPGHGAAQASFQAGRLPSAPGADMRSTYSARDASQQAGPRYPADAYSRPAVMEQPVWHRDSTRTPISSTFFGSQLTAPEVSASYPASRSLQKGSGPPFAVSQNAMQTDEQPAQLVLQHSTAAVAPSYRPAAGRQNGKSEGPPFALAVEGSGHAVQSLPEPKSRETSPPYATHVQHGPADSPSMQAQARVLLSSSQDTSYGRYTDPSLPQVAIRQAQDVNGLVRDEHESIGMSVDGDRAGSLVASSPRHSISSLRPYANDASLQDFRVHAQLMEDRLMTVNSENQRLHAEYARMPETSAGKTLAERRRRAEVEARLDSNTKEASNIRLQLKRLHAQSS